MFRMDDGDVTIVEAPVALENPAQFSANERERLKCAYADALALI